MAVAFGLWASAHRPSQELDVFTAPPVAIEVLIGTACFGEDFAFVRVIDFQVFQV
jgi:hypothetical protein